MARILQDGRAQEIRDIAVDERTSVLLEPNGQAVVVGTGHAYLLQSAERPEVCKAGTPLTFRGIAAQRLGAGQHFDVGRWSSSEGTPYMLEVEDGWGAVYASGWNGLYEMTASETALGAWQRTSVGLSSV